MHLVNKDKEKYQAKGLSSGKVGLGLVPLIGLVLLGINSIHEGIGLSITLTPSHEGEEVVNTEPIYIEGIEFLNEEQAFLQASQLFKDNKVQRSLTLFDFLAKKGFAQAHFFIGKANQIGYGVEKDRIKAKFHFEEGLAAGDSTYAAAGLYELFYQETNQKDIVASSFILNMQFMNYLIEEADRGHWMAQCLLGQLYFKGGKNLPKNEFLANKWLKSSAEQGYPLAEYLLGAAYEKRGDYLIALEWYAKAGLKDLPEAYHALAGLFEEGKGVEKDLEEAQRYYRKAATLGHQDSLEALKLLRID